MKKCIIFGAGERGRYQLQRLGNFFEIIAFADNNEALWGTKLSGIPVITPDETKPFYESGAIVVICNEMHSYEIANQLGDLGIDSYINYGSSMTLFRNGNEYKTKLSTHIPPSKNNTFSIIYVQLKPCVRTNKIARMMKQKGVRTYSAYMNAPSDAGSASYYEEYGFLNDHELLQFVNDSEFDIVHCSNEPDALTNLLLHSNKTIINDCHDIMTLAHVNANADLILQEQIANLMADGSIYPSVGMRDYIVNRYGTDINKTLVLGNYPLNDYAIENAHSKLSDVDGEVHCVYEGQISDDAQTYRYYQDLWRILATKRVHVHFFTAFNPDYCDKICALSEFLHYEGNYIGDALMDELTKFDIGLLLFNLKHDKQAKYLSICSPNKQFEYLCAGLPVATNIRRFSDFLKTFECGDFLDFDDDIVRQLRRIRSIPIERGFLAANGFTMETDADRTLEFYNACLYRSTHRL